MSSAVMSSMTIGKVATISLVSLGKAERDIVGRRRPEWLDERCADRRLLHVDRLDLAELRLRCRLECQPAELGEVAGAAHPGSGRGEERLRAKEIAQRLLGLGADLAHEERVRTDLAAELRQGRRDERRPALPLAIPRLLEGGVELAG